MDRKVTARRGKSGSRRFASVPTISTPRSTFNHSHGHTTTLDPGFLIPILCLEILPGDTIRLAVQSFIRQLTALFPVLDQGWIDTQCWFTANRLVWDDFKKFMGEEENPGDSIDFTVPTVDIASTISSETVYDYFGIPIEVDLSGQDINALPFRAMNLIWNEWYRPEDIVDSVTVLRDAGPDPEATYTKLRRAKRHDYFTACQPFLQKGPAPEVSFGGTAPINATGNKSPDFRGITDTTVYQLTRNQGGGVLGYTMTGSPPSTGVTDQLRWNNPKLEADLSAATGITISAVREVVTLQQFYERQSRGGTRYIEQIRSMFGVSSPDMRQQRPEYLCGTSHPLNVHPIAMTGGTFSGNRTGDLGAFVTGGGESGTTTYSATEHGYIIMFASVRANLTYQQGLHRMWSRQTRFDFAWPQFAMLSEQEVLSKEIYVDGTANDEDVFGYQERYAEYRYAENRISGKFRSADPVSLDPWHLAQDFATRPVLNEDFILEDPPFLRTVAVQDEPIFKGDFFFNIDLTRPLPVKSVPGLTRF